MYFSLSADVFKQSVIEIVWSEDFLITVKLWVNLLG